MSTKKNIAYNTVLNVANIAFPIITTPYISRILGVANIGVVSFAQTYVTYFTLFAALGIPVYGIREIAKHNHDLNSRNKIFSELFFINLFCTILSSLVFIITIFTIPILYQDREFLLIAGGALFFNVFNIDWFFSGRENFKLITLRSILAKIIMLGGLFIFVRTRDDVIPYLALTVMANVLSQMWNFGYLLKKEISIQFKNLEIKRHLNSILVLFASNIAISVYTILGTLLLGFMSDYIQVGYYTSAMKISKLILPVVVSISPVMMARINTLKGEHTHHVEDQISKLLNRSFEIMMMLAVPITLGLIMISPRFVPFFFGSEFIPATISLQLLSLLILIIGVNNFFGVQILVSMSYEKKFLIAVLLGTASSLFLNIILITPYGALGASIAAVIAEIIVTIAVIIFSLKIISVHISTKSILHPILASLPIIPISFGFNCIIDQNFGYLSATIITSGVLYAFVMIVLFKNEQLNQLLNSFVRKIKK